MDIIEFTIGEGKDMDLDLSRADEGVSANRCYIFYINGCTKRI